MKSPCGVKLERKSFAGERQTEDDAIVRVRSRRDGQRQTRWHDCVEERRRAQRLRRRRVGQLWQRAEERRCAGKLRRRRAGRLRQRAERLRRRVGQLQWRAAAVALGYGGAGDYGKEAARARSGGGLRRKKENTGSEQTVKGLRSAFHVMTGHGGRMTGRSGAASGQSPVRSWSDQTRPVRHDRTLTESGQRLLGKLKRMTGRGGGGRDRTRWSQRCVRCSVRSQILEKFFGMTGRASGRRDQTQW
jgi:hypothetical protein